MKFVFVDKVCRRENEVYCVTKLLIKRIQLMLSGINNSRSIQCSLVYDKFVVDRERENKGKK